MWETATDVKILVICSQILASCEMWTYIYKGNNIDMYEPVATNSHDNSSFILQNIMYL